MIEKGDHNPKKKNRLVFDGKKQKLGFQGDCLDVLSVCEAMCCRVKWKISLSLKEYESGLYQAEQICRLTEKACHKPAVKCNSRSYQLKKNASGTCPHLNDDNLCAIYENRPKVCKDFSCRGGWQLTSVFPVDGADAVPSPKPEKGLFIERLTEDLLFVPHPLIKLHTVFNKKAEGKIIFVKEMAGGCGIFHTGDRFEHPDLSDEMLLAMIQSFSSKETLEQVRQHWVSRHSVNIERRDFYEIVWLFNKHNLILDARNFRGMLSGMGWIPKSHE